MLNFNCGDIHKTRTVDTYVEASNRPNDFAALMPNGKTIPQNGNLAGKAGKRQHREDRNDTDNAFKT